MMDMRWRSLDVERYPHEPFLGRVWQLQDNLTAYDAIYVALAEAHCIELFPGRNDSLSLCGARCNSTKWRSPA